MSHWVKRDQIDTGRWSPLGGIFPQSTLQIMACCLDIISWTNQIIWGWKVLPLLDLLSFWLQDKQHVAHYAGKFYFVHTKRTGFSWQFPECSITFVWSRNGKEGGWPMVSSSTCMLWFRNVEYGAKEIKVLLILWINLLSTGKSFIPRWEAGSLAQLWVSSESP